MQVERSQTTVGSGDFTYDIESFGRLPAGMTMFKVAGVAVDKDDNVYAFARGGSAPIVIFDRKGDFLGSWGVGEFVNPHALHIGRDNLLYCTDDMNHVVRKYTLEGKLLLTIGVPGQGTPRYSGKPFSRCTHTALSPENDIYVSDGYWNASVHKYSQEGKHILSWGSSGIEPGEFNIAHNICCDDAGWVYVADRENHRIQVFNGKGTFEGEWSQVHRPCGLTVEMPENGLCFVAELGPAYEPTNGQSPNLGPRVSVLAKDGTVVARIDNDPSAPPITQYFTPHCICTDSAGSIYVADPMGTWPARFPNEPIPQGPGSLKKLTKKA
jgi:DNA-binding beta-propeller fold protein YncE